LSWPYRPETQQRRKCKALRGAWHLELRHDRPIDIDRTPQEVFYDSFAQCGPTRAGVGGQRACGRIAMLAADLPKAAADFS